MQVPVTSGRLDSFRYLTVTSVFRSFRSTVGNGLTVAGADGAGLCWISVGFFRCYNVTHAAEQYPHCGRLCNMCSDSLYIRKRLCIMTTPTTQTRQKRCK
jgi:hypothetical protein